MIGQRLRTQLARLEHDVADQIKAVERAAQHGRLSAFRPVGADGHRWPSWVIALKGQPGCYVIRDANSRLALYVGSAKKNLYDTLTRHFQTWRRKNARQTVRAALYWKGFRGRGAHDPGLVYKRSRSEVAIQLTEPDQRLEIEAELIQRWTPRDNLVEHPDGVPDGDALVGGRDREDEDLVGDFDGEEAPF